MDVAELDPDPDEAPEAAGDEVLAAGADAAAGFSAGLLSEPPEDADESAAAGFSALSLFSPFSLLPSVGGFILSE